MKKLSIVLSALLVSMTGIYLAFGANQSFNAFITGLTASSTIGGGELLPCVQGGVTTKCTPAQLNTYIQSQATPINGLPAASLLSAADVLPAYIQSATATQKVTGTQLQTFVVGNGFLSVNGLSFGTIGPVNGIDFDGTFLRFWGASNLNGYFNSGTGTLTVNKAYADGSVAFYPQTTGFTQTLSSTVQTVVLNPAGTLATGTITMPASPANGQIVQVGTTQIITALTVSPNSGQTLTGAPTTLTPSAGFRYIYVTGISTWVRLN